MKSGNDSPSGTGSNANSAGQPSAASSSKSLPTTETTSSVPSVPKPGDLKAIRNSVVNNLVNVAEEKTSQPISKQGREALVHYIDSATKGYVGSLGMICKGPSCPFISDCPLNKIKSQLPIGEKCPVENAMVTMWLNKHLKALGIEDPNDPIHSFDMDMLYELAGQELIRWRCSVHLSDDPRLVSNQQVGATQQGEPIFADVINPVLEVMEKAGKNISKIREALVATREAQIKAGQLATDPTERAALLREEAIAKINKRRQAKEETKDAEFEVKNSEG